MTIKDFKVIDRVRYTLRRKYRSGHRIHSPYVYNLVRELFMKTRNTVVSSDAELTVALCEKGLKYDYSYRMGQFLKYNHLKKYSLNPLQYDGEDLIVVTRIDGSEQLDAMIAQMRLDHSRSALIVLGIYRNKECREWWSRQHQLSLDLYRVGILVYDEQLNPEYFKLKI